MAPPNRPRVRPLDHPPTGALGDSQEQAHQRRRQPDGAEQVELSSAANRGFGNQHQHEDEGQHAEAGGGPEQDVPVGLLGQKGG